MLIRSFLDKLRAEDGLAHNTILSYGKDLELFEKFLSEKNIKIEEATSENIKDYFYILNKDNLRSASIARKISSLKNFYKFLADENIIKSNPTLNLHNPKKDAKLPKFLTPEEIFKLLDFVNKDESEFGIKLSCMLEILYASGMRVSELVALQISQIQEIVNENGEKTLRNYLIIKGKGNKERMIVLNKSAIKILMKYLDLRHRMHNSDSKWLFSGFIRCSKSKDRIRSKKLNSDHPITRQRFHQMLKELALKVGIDPTRIHPHVIRHSFATHLLNNGADLRILQELMGHSDISSTEIYTHILDSKLKDLVFNKHPLKNYKK
ncbi:MAG: tyrosine recombinase [Pelagibacterales bacterium]|nr:tyrosine recombinase [Pelagibacterales bacterium]